MRVASTGVSCRFPLQPWPSPTPNFLSTGPCFPCSELPFCNPQSLTILTLHLSPDFIPSIFLGNDQLEKSGRLILRSVESCLASCAGVWSPEPDLRRPRAGAALVACSDKLYVIGGADQVVYAACGVWLANLREGSRSQRAYCMRAHAYSPGYTQIRTTHTPPGHTPLRHYAKLYEGWFAM